MSGGEAGRGVQVVSVNDDHSYTLNEDALEQILLRQDVKDLPVVIVSVAGAYRGGKSFILDFFLRYLRSQQSNRNNGKWLGGDDEALQGFSWRGGSERNTTGIVLWSEPIRVTLLSGEKVAVFLMDTQGTFDSHSTIRDSSTIFALSTLLCSVQIYNLSQLIKEDDLQHLQLFTEYGRLARDQDGKPFQVLQFLIRDWTFPYEYSYGSSGGNKMLEKKLEVNSQQPQELREIREHIHSCFDSVTCFLMPHPGFGVTDPNFTGCLSGIRVEFKNSLLELVPSIFDPANLTPKIINGRKVKAREVFTYFQSYIKTFNSDELPTPVSILKATSEAGLLTSAMEAREQYESAMERECGSEEPSMLPAALRQLHHAAVAGAATIFTVKKKMGPQQDIDAHLERLIQELDSRLTQYMSLNEGKTQKGIADSKKAYEDSLNNVRKEQPLCLHPTDLDEVHRDAVEVAMGVFDSNRKPSVGKNDDVRSNLAADFAESLMQLHISNDQNNNAVVMQAHQEYMNSLDQVIHNGSCVSSRYLNKKHEEARDRALNAFKNKRNRYVHHPEDTYLAELIRNIEKYFSKQELINKNSNKTAAQTAIYCYNNHMASIWGPQTGCLHPDDLEREHKVALNLALREFRSSRTSGEGGDRGGDQVDSDDDSYSNHDGDDDEDDMDDDEVKENLLQSLNSRYTELCEINMRSNELAVEAAYNEYCRKMDAKCAPSLASILILPWVVKVLVQLPKYHQRAMAAALELFSNRRRLGRQHDYDEYLDDLKSKLANSYDDYCNPIKALARELGVDIGQ